MQRSSYKAIDRYYNQGTQYNVPMAIFRRSVMPGQTANLDAMLDVRTAALPPTTSKMVCSVSYFFVPYRLIWDGWVDFITDGTGTFPASAAQIPELFDTQSNNSAMMRRAYKLIYNQYYGDENSESGLYTVTSDATTTLDKPVLALEQRYREVLKSDQFTDDSYVAPVDGTPEATINLSDFSRANSNARRDFRFEKSGDKYVDFLRQFGVEPNWETQDAPEHLGSVTKDIKPRIQAATDGASLGSLRSYYSAEIAGRFQSKRFMEHGIVVGVAYMRPVIFNKALCASDVRMVSRENFFNGDNVNIKGTWGNLAGGAADDVIVPPAYRYSVGQHVFNDNGATGDLALTIDNGDLNRRYGVITISPSEATLGTDSFCYTNDVTWSGKSPASTALTF